MCCDVKCYFNSLLPLNDMHTGLLSKPTHSMNPYVRLSYGDVKQQTSVTRGTLLPLWNESFIFPFQEYANFKLTVYNKVAFGRDEVVGKLCKARGTP